MLPRGITRIVRKRSPLKRFLLVLLTFVIIISGAEFWGTGVNAQYVVPIEKIPKLQKVGPIHEDYGYPVWYKDSKGLRLELCVDVNDPNCALDPAEIPDSTKPISLINDNFPAELFYQLAGSEIDLPNGGRAVATFALEAAWANEIPQDGDQIVFGRVRFRIDGLITGKEYTIYHPYGVDKFTAEVEDEDEPDVGEIRFVEDIGVNGGFEGAKKSRIGTFLEWDEGAPAGYIGDPNENHKIKNGFKDENGVEQNYFKIVGEEGSGIGIGTDEDSPLYCGPDCIQTDLFSLMGKKAVNSGVDVARATYSKVIKDGSPVGTIDVFASTEEGDNKDIVVSAPGVDQVKLKGSNGNYFARIPFDATKEPPELTITNRSDTPDSVKTVKPVDKINATANYNTIDDKLTIHAASSDEINPPKLDVDGFGTIIADDGILSIQIGINDEEPTKYIPPNIKVTSYIDVNGNGKLDEENGIDVVMGDVIVPVEIDGNSFTPETILASAKADSEAVVGEEISLDGSASAGPIQSYLWTQTSGPNVVSITDADKAVAKITVPVPNVTNEPLVFTLTVTGINGSTAASTVTVKINQPAPTPTVANAGTPQTVDQGVEVTLNGSATTGATEYSWKLLSGPAPVTISNSTSAIAKFTAPKKEGKYVFELTAIGTGGQSKHQVEITTKPGTLSNIIAQLRGTEWRVSGQSSVIGPGVTVEIFLGQKKIGSTVVTNTGAWSFRKIDEVVPNGTQITIKSSSGGTATARITVR